MRNRSDRGQASLFAIVLLVFGVVLALLIVLTGEVVIDRAQAQTAADAAALVGVVEGRAAAGRYAKLNGATLVEFARTGQRVRVVVTLDRVRATAVAESRQRLALPE